MNNDLISREALKKVIEDSVSQYGGQYSADMLNMWALFSHIINDAPTVEITEEQAIDKLHETGWLPRHDKEISERPTVEPCYQTTSCLDCKMYDKENHHCPRFCEVIRELVKETENE